MRGGGSRMGRGDAGGECGAIKRSFVCQCDMITFHATYYRTVSTGKENENLIIFTSKILTE